MLDYSPYENIIAKAYPAIMVAGGLTDSRVQYFEPAKFVAKLRHFKTNENCRPDESGRTPLILRMGAWGHFGSTGDAWTEDTSERLFFVMTQLGVTI
jgi:oligopeptidase B